MNDPLAKKPPPPGRRASIALAVAVHVGLAIFLIYGVHWQTERPEAVEVELVTAAPAPAAEPPPPEQKPEPAPEPKPEPKVEPKPAPPPPKPEIALKDKKEKPKPAPKEPPPPPFNPFQQQLAADERQLALQRQLADDQRRLDEQKAAQAVAQTRTARDKAIASWQNKIASKIKPNIIRPANATGNPEAIFEITLLPDGSLIGEPRMKKSTGNPVLDSAIDNAIRKSAPLPKPDDPSIFQRLIEFKFRPLED